MLEMQAKLATLKSGGAGVSVPDLLELAGQGLPQMLDPASGLFCYRLKKRERGVEREGKSHRYTMMTLLGLHRYEQTGAQLPIPIDTVLRSLICDLSWVESAGDLGLVLWTCAEASPDRLPDVVRQLRPFGAVARYADGQRASTMEIAWVVTGAVQCALAGFEHPDVAAEGKRAMDLLKRNWGSSGLFGHQACDKSLAGRLRGKIGSFADQVYPIFALSKYAQAFGDSEARKMALHCADKICRVQGQRGEWWWHYDAQTGNVTETYPVYSVHQHGMAPMALFALGDLTGKDFTGPIQKGIDWVCGHNELNFDMRDENAGVIWRNFDPPPLSRRWHQIVGIAGRPSLTSAPKLKVNFECRPYELGWLLYAFANRTET